MINMNYESPKFKLYFHLNNKHKITKYLNDPTFNYKYKNKHNKSILIFFIEMYNNKKIFLKNIKFRKVIKNYIIQWLKEKKFSLYTEIKKGNIEMTHKDSDFDIIKPIKYTFFHIPKSRIFMKYVDMSNFSNILYKYHHHYVNFWEFFFRMIKYNKKKYTYLKFLVNWIYDTHWLKNFLYHLNDNSVRISRREYNKLELETQKLLSFDIWHDSFSSIKPIKKEWEKYFESLIAVKIIKYMFKKKHIYNHVYKYLATHDKLRNTLHKNIHWNQEFNKYFYKFMNEQIDMPSHKYYKKIYWENTLESELRDFGRIISEDIPTDIGIDIDFYLQQNKTLLTKEEEKDFHIISDDDKLMIHFKNYDIDNSIDDDENEKKIMAYMKNVWPRF